MIIKIFFGIIFLCIVAQVQGQGFSPLASTGVKFTTDATPDEGRNRLIVGMMTGDDGLPIGGYAYYKEQKKKWVDPSTVDDPLFVQNNGIIGRTFNGQMMMISYEDFTRPHREITLFEWAFQGSMLIQDGKALKIPRTEKAYYSAIGFRQDGAIEIFNSYFAPVTLKEFTDDILLYNGGCENVMLLDVASSFAFLRPLSDYEQARMATDPTYTVDRVERNDLAIDDTKMKIHFVDFAHRLWTK